ncbi:hypothetical protein [Streptomyces sp. NPDC048737]|uniref:hypothetical protein n=1 Tax=unclassified Streptomyces TaxID=2593676 RepID=UPI00341B4B72
MQEQGELVAEYGTSFTRTAVHRCPDDEWGWRWVRSAGPSRAAPMRVPPEPAAEAIARLPEGALRFSLPRQVGDTLVHKAGGPLALAKLLMSRHPGEAYPLARSMLRELGAALRRLHAAPAGEAAAASHPGLRRLSRWLAGEPPADTEQPTAGQLLQAVVERLGPERRTTLQAWCSTVLEDQAGRVLLHGNPGSGLVVPDPDGRAGVLLVGEDLAAGPAYVDTGWVLGELAELRGVIRSKGGAAPAAQWSTLGRSFVEGHGGDLPGEAGIVATLGVLAHIRDYCAFVGWDEWWISVALDIVAEEVDKRGSGMLEW